MVSRTARPNTGSKFSLAYLQAELARAELLLRGYAVRQKIENNQEDFDPDSVAGALDPEYHQFGVHYVWEAEPGSFWADYPEWRQAYAAAGRRSAQVAKQAARAGETLHLQQLVTAFGLDEFEVDIFLLALLPAIDPTIGRVFALLHDEATLTYPTVKLTLDVLCDDPDLSRLTRLAHFAPDAPLLRFGLLTLASETRVVPTPLLSQGLGVDPAVIVWLLGRYQPHSALGAFAKLESPHTGSLHTEASDKLLAAEAWPQLAALGQEPMILAFHGIDAESQSAAARLFAASRGQSLLTVDLPAVLKNGMTDRAPSAATAFRFALRDARLAGAIPYLTGFDACLEEGNLPAALVKLMVEQPGSLITSSSGHWRTEKEWSARPIVYHAFPVPGYAQRRALWAYYLGDRAEEQADLTNLAGQFALESGRIRNVVAVARLAAQRRGESTPRQEDFFAAARAYSSTHLDDLAHRVRLRHRWEDLVLPPAKIALLHEMVAMVRGRPKVLDEWGVGGKLVPSRAVNALFCGEPGTGKTMAADVMAGELGLDLYKIELSSMVDKYIGETEKNLERIFREAESANAILFFDEADALFGKRTGVKDSHDRYANIGVSYLLQRMESFDGITILSTNLRANLDEAFTRRMHFVVDFPFPDVEERLRIWEALFPPSVPRAADVDLAWLAQRFKLPGGSIRNIIVSAAYLAADAGEVVEMSHLTHGARRELQKIGRLSVGDEEEYARHVEARNAKLENGPDDDDYKKSRLYPMRPSRSR